MNTYELIMNIGPQFLLMIITVVHLRNRPKIKDFNRKTVTDKRLGTLGLRHFDTPTKSCYEYGCTDDCPVSRSR